MDTPITIGEFLQERTGRYKPDDNEIANLQRLDKINFSGEIFLSAKPSKTDMIKIQPGDLVISGINVAKGAISVYEGDKPICATIHYSSYQFDNKRIDIQFFKRFVKSPNFISALQDQVKGGIKTEIKAKHILPLQVKIPDIAQQKMLNRKFDAIDNEIEQLNTEIITQTTLLTQLRQSILQEAIEGKLTADWRASTRLNNHQKNKLNHESTPIDTNKKKDIRVHSSSFVVDDLEYAPASVLLEHIKVEKEKLVAEGKIKKQKPLAPIKPEELPFELPAGWVWTRLETFGFLSGGGTPSKSKIEYWNGNIPWVSPKDMKFDYISDSIDTITETGLHNSSAKLIHIGSILFVVRGMILAHTFPIGITQKPVTINQDMKALTPYLPSMSEYCAKMLKGFSKKILGLTNTSTHGTKRLEYSHSYGKLLFPLPPLAEQKAIVERVDKLLAMVDDLEEQVAGRKVQAEQLMQSVLREAFAG